MSSSLGSSSSGSSGWIYDVFLAYATGCNTIISLQNSLKYVAVDTSIDDHELTVDLLYRHIKGSRIVIIIFTEKFLDSPLSLMVFEVIMRCHKSTNQMVFALFWRDNNGNEVMRVVRFEDEFRRLVAWNNEVEESIWTSAAAGAAVKCSWEVSTVGGCKEIKDVMFFIKRVLDPTYSMLFPRHPVGIQLRMDEILHLLKFYSEDYDTKMFANIVGIWGKGGIGKTTIARAIFNHIEHNFQCRSFLTNIKNVWEQDNGQLCLQKQLILEVSGYTECVELHDDIEMRIEQLKRTIRYKKALVILDDVSNIEQLEALCVSRKWFGRNSLILITTRIKHLLDQLDVDCVYEVKKLDKNESLELFSYHAFQQSIPMNGFRDLSKKAISYCEGLPLALEVLGSLLHDKKIQEWKSVLKKLKGIPKIQEKLKLSYDFLDNLEKDVFINIACFYVGKSKDYVTQSDTILDVLIKRNLVKIDKNDMFDVHDLLQEIARGINRDTSKPKYIHDVFLSFRGEDTRKSFATHLYTALKQAGIEVFMDKGIRRGENIVSSLLQAIESSRISIIIFSTNYSGSRWCLQELEKIMECHRTSGQEVLPIFYDVQPSEVRKQNNIFGKGLEGLMMKISASKDKKLSWQRALNEAANLSGWNLHDYRTESELIDNILETITKKLDDNMYLFVAHHPVGLDSRVHHITQLLSTKSNEVIIVGIWGMGGIGKTTIAKAIYNQIGPNFEAKSFLANIRGAWEQDNGQVHLQEQLVSDIIKTRRVTLASVELGKSIMMERLSHKRALIVLDDVNNVDQLNALCGSRQWFGQGSRIIITTRDEHLLKILRVVRVYDAKEMDNSESLELFSWHAFKQAFPERNFYELSTRVVSYSGGLPLALEVLGSYLYDREIPYWESVLEKLQRIPNDQIHEKLKISYDGLSDHTEKDIFLDICCFFMGKNRNYVTQILNDCRLHADIGITRLIELSLVKVDKKNKLEMHDLLRDMGREIIRDMSPEEPEKRTRLWFQDDVLDVLRNKTGTVAIKGLALNLSRSKNIVPLSTKSFKKMKKLRLLQFDNVKLDGDYEYLSKELRWLSWHGFPLENIPMDFTQESMVAIDLKYSNLKQVWKKSQVLERLKILNLSHSHYLTQTPDFSKIPNLEKLRLKDCPRLSIVHPTIGDLKHIILLNFKDCKDLNNLPRSIYNLKSLKTLNLSGCWKIDKLEEDIEQMESLTTLVANQTAITQVPFSLVRSKSIQYVSLCGHEGLSSDVFPTLIWSWMSPTKNPKSLIQGLWHHLFPKNNSILETRSSTSQVSCRKGTTSIDFPKQVQMAIGSRNFTSSLTIQAGRFNEVTHTLLKSISQGWSDRGFGDYTLPDDNYPDWLHFKSEGLSVLFKVPQVTNRSLQGMILCIVYLSPQDNMTSVYPLSVLIKDYTKPNIELYKRDHGVSTSEDEKWHKIINDLVAGNEVEVKVESFARQLDVKETVIYLVYGEDVDNRKCIEY